LTHTSEFFGAPLVVVDLGVQEVCHVTNTVGLGLLDILHAAKDIF
jgi:hypothetical protein